MTIPDSDVFVPEFGLCLPPELTLDFDDAESPQEARYRGIEDFGLDLSDPLQTPLSKTHDFSLPDYECDISAGRDSNDSGFGDFSGSGGFSGDLGEYDDDILRYADDAGNLDFSLDPTPLRPRKRRLEETAGAEIRTRHISAEDEDIQRIVRGDHDFARQLQFDNMDDNMNGFREPNFDNYRTPPPIDEPGTERITQDITARPKRKKRVIIIEDDSATVRDADFRSWPEKYLKTQAAAITRRRAFEMAKLAKDRAERYLWEWGGRNSAFY